MQNNAAIPDRLVMSKIHIVRDQKIMLDRDLAELYGVETKVLKQAVRRNKRRFPSDFMFELNYKEFEDLRSQIVTTKSGGTKYMPMAFTEHGVLMLSSVLRSESAIDMNIQIMRIFSKMKEIHSTHKDLFLKVEEIENRVTTHDEKLKLIFQFLKKFIEGKDAARTPIGFKK